MKGLARYFAPLQLQSPLWRSPSASQAVTGIGGSQQRNAGGNWIRVVAVVLSLAALTVPIWGICEDAPKPQLQVDARSGKGFTTWVESRIATGEGVQLKLTKFDKHYGGKGYSYITECPGYSGIPQDVSDNSESLFCYASLHESLDFKDYDTGFYFYYDILIPDGTGGWRPSGFWVNGATMVPMIGERKIDCSIGMAGSADPSTKAPFSCTTSWTGSGYDSKPHWKVTTKPVQVIDASDSAEAARAAQLIGENCQITDTPRCVWTRTQKSSAFLPNRKDWQSLTNWADSCPPTDPARPFVLTSNRNVQISWSDKVGGKIFSKVAGDVLVVKVEVGLEVSFEHSITQSDSYGEGYQYSIPYGYRSALYLQHGMLEVHGNFSISSDTDRYLIKNAIFRFPLERDVQVEGRGQPVPRGVVNHVDIPCSEKAPSVGAPPPPKAEHGLATRRN